LAFHLVVVGSAVSGGGFYSRQIIMSTRFFRFLLPSSFRLFEDEKKRTGDHSQVLGNRVSASLMKGI